MTKKTTRSSKSQPSKIRSTSKKDQLPLIESKDTVARLYLGIDQGSSSTKAVLLRFLGDQSGRLTDRISGAENEGRIISILDELIIDVPPIRYKGTAAEQDAEAILATIQASIEWGVERAYQLGGHLLSIGLAVQRSGVLAWDQSTGQPLTKMITWADNRFKAEIDSLKMTAARIHGLTGLAPLPNFAAPKIAYLQQMFPDRSVHVGTLDSFIMFRLSGDAKIFITEDTMASRTLLYDLQCGGWSPELCKIFNVEQGRLPRIRPSLGEHLKVGVNDQSIAITAMIGDQQAAILGRDLNQDVDNECNHLAVGSHSTKRGALLNLGTIASLLVDLGKMCGVGPNDISLKIPQLKTNVLYSEECGSLVKRYFLVELTSPITGRLLLEPQTRGLCQGLERLQSLCEESCGLRPVPPIKPLFEDLLKIIAQEELSLDGVVDMYASGEASKFFESLDQITLWPEAELDQIFSMRICGEVEIGIADQARAVVESVGNVLSIMLLIFAKSGLIDMVAGDAHHEEAHHGVAHNGVAHNGEAHNGEAHNGVARRQLGRYVAVAGGAAKLNYLLDYVSARSGYQFELTSGQDNGAIGSALAAIRGFMTKALNADELSTK